MDINTRMIVEFESNWRKWDNEGRCSNSVYLRNCVDLYNTSKCLVRNDCSTTWEFIYIQNSNARWFNRYEYSLRGCLNEISIRFN